MVESDSVDGLVKLSSNETTYPDHHFLISVERTAKLDLLTHLLAHLNSSIVVCGPKGIGKTTLLNALQERQTPVWQYCTLAATPEFTLETLQAAIAGSTANRVKTTIVIIDDAVFLIPGIINLILNYATRNNHLRLILALTPDGLYLKNSSDNLINDCPVIEIPPLNEKQCGDYLQYLAARPDGRFSASNVNEDAAAQIYRETHGIPGNIIHTLPRFNRNPKPDRTLALLIAAVMILVAATLSLQWLKPNIPIFPSPNTESHPPAPENRP